MHLKVQERGWVKAYSITTKTLAPPFQVHVQVVKIIKERNKIVNRPNSSISS